MSTFAKFTAKNIQFQQFCDDMTRHIILTEDGSHTIFVPEMGEHYHSVHGAVMESRHIFIGHGMKKVQTDPLSILEIGFGTGLNAFLTVLESNRLSRRVRYESWEAFPLSEAEYGMLNYPALVGAGDDLFSRLHQLPWGYEQSVTPLFQLKKVHGDIGKFNSDKRFDLVYFDAFGPDFQPELWETRIFRMIEETMKENSRLVTYSAKGQVRRNLKEAGFVIEKAPGPPGKREITIALKV